MWWVGSVRGGKTLLFLLLEEELDVFRGSYSIGGFEGENSALKMQHLPTSWGWMLGL